MTVLTNVRSHVFSGTHHEIGVQQGKASREQIHELLEKIPNFDFVKLMKPRLLPASLFVMMAKRRAGKLLTNDIFKYYPRQAQRMSGIAEGQRQTCPHLVHASNGVIDKQTKLPN